MGELREAMGESIGGAMSETRSPGQSSAVNLATQDFYSVCGFWGVCRIGWSIIRIRGCWV